MTLTEKNQEIIDLKASVAGKAEKVQRRKEMYHQHIQPVLAESLSPERLGILYSGFDVSMYDEAGFSESHIVQLQTLVLDPETKDVQSYVKLVVGFGFDLASGNAYLVAGNADWSDMIFSSKLVPVESASQLINNIKTLVDKLVDYFDQNILDEKLTGQTFWDQFSWK